MATVPKTILIKGEGDCIKERLAGGGIKPGHLINLNASNAVVVHASAEGDAFAAFALENESIGKDIDTAYVSGDLVPYCIPERGDEIYALLPPSAAAVVIGDELVSNGDGTLKKITAAAVTVGNLRRVVARALQAIDNSGNAASAVRIIVEVV